MKQYFCDVVMTFVDLISQPRTVGFIFMEAVVIIGFVYISKKIKRKDLEEEVLSLGLITMGFIVIGLFVISLFACWLKMTFH